MKLSGRLLILILVAVFIQGQVPGAQAQGAVEEQNVALDGIYTGWIEIDVRHAWDNPQPDEYVLDNYFSFNYVRSRGRIDLMFAAGIPLDVKIDLRLVFYAIAIQRTVVPGAPEDICQGFSSFTTGYSNADYEGPADGSALAFTIKPFTFMPDSTKASLAGTGGDCTSQIESARLETLGAVETEAMIPENFEWQFETTRWTKDEAFIDGICSSAGYEKMQGAAVQCFWHAFKLPEPTPLVVPPRKR